MELARLVLARRRREKPSLPLHLLRRRMLAAGGATAQATRARRGNSGAPWQNEIASIAGVPHVAGLSCRMALKRAAGNIDFLVLPGASRPAAVAGQRNDASPGDNAMRALRIARTLNHRIIAVALLGTPVEGMEDVAEHEYRQLFGEFGYPTMYPRSA